MTKIEFLDRLPSGWFVLAVMKRKPRCRDWVALIVNTHPDERLALNRTYREGWIHIAGKHKNWDAACDALEAMVATRH